MKKLISIIFICVCVILFASCQAKEKNNGVNQETKQLKNVQKTIKVVCMPLSEPIVEMYNKFLEDDGMKIEPVVFDGNHLPATALADGSVDAVILNHKPWIETFNKENNTDLVMPEPYLYYSMNALYSMKHDKVEDLKNGTIAVAGDPVNLDRALKLLDSVNLIKLKKKDEGFYTLVDIEENTGNIDILETEITATARSYKDVDGMIAVASVVKQAGFDHRDFLVEDPVNKDFPLGLIVQEKDKDADWLKKMHDCQGSKEFKEIFDKEYEGAYGLYE
ncbi:MetQ/NlpA family ABC transporter substrate-binding protein [Lagierella sp.]|uniref:MetQ/NlpA family ABC transporter substrate-binding protein n=1 Tax=Lagierella sp. TaxID=2849657 RepID=UPI00261F0CE7|nr:MetQ/NlpA family ABC transporter substrate-binding protein [Lagierella sp.]